MPLSVCRKVLRNLEASNRYQEKHRLSNGRGHTCEVGLGRYTPEVQQRKPLKNDGWKMIRLPFGARLISGAMC